MKPGAGLAETLAVVRCVECGAEAVAPEGWHVYFADLGEVPVYCESCAVWEFGANLAPKAGGGQRS